MMLLKIKYYMWRIMTLLISSKPKMFLWIIIIF